MTSRLLMVISTLGLVGQAFAREPLRAKAELKNGQGKKIGTVELSQAGEGVLLRVRAEQLPPGVHAIHIHEKASCKGPDFKSAGGHFSSESQQHGYQNAQGPHAGDLPNVKVGADGQLEADLYTDQVSLKRGETNSLFAGSGTSIVIHAGKDDYRSNPAGDSGDRIACGEIKTDRAMG